MTKFLTKVDRLLSDYRKYDEVEKCQKLTAFDLVRFPNPHYVVGWGTEPLHRG